MLWMGPRVVDPPIQASAKLVNAEKRISSAHNFVTKVKDLTYCAEIAFQKMKGMSDQGLENILFLMQHFLYSVQQSMNFHVCYEWK